MTNISVVIEVKPKYFPHFKQTLRRRLLSQVSKQLSRGFPTYGIYHSHNTEHKGGEFNPHVHLLVSVPDECLERFLDGLPTDLEQKDETGYFQLSDHNRWVLDFDGSLLAYSLGSERRHLPKIVYGRV